MNPTCSGCGGPHPFDTTVPSVVWNRVIRANGLPDYLCTTCIVSAFVSRGESFTAELIGATMPRTAIEVRVNGAEARDAAAISEENTALRAQLREAQHPQQDESIDVAVVRMRAGDFNEGYRAGYSDGLEGNASDSESAWCVSKASASLGVPSEAAQTAKAGQMKSSALKYGDVV